LDRLLLIDAVALPTDHTMQRGGRP